MKKYALMVAEKPSVAKSVAELLGGKNLRKVSQLIHYFFSSQSYPLLPILTDLIKEQIQPCF